ARNIISGNSSAGVNIRLGASGNFVQGNYIGTDVTGNVALANGAVVQGFGSAGVAIQHGATNNTIGGTDPGAGNVISGNVGWGGFGVSIYDTTGTLVQGNFIGTNATGTAALANAGTDVLLAFASGNTIGGTSPAARNIISGSVFS